MKTILFFFVSFNIITTVFAQQSIYNPFRLDLAIGLAFPTGNTFLDQRFSFSAEPKYNLSDQFTLGLKIEIDPNSDFAGTSDPFTINSVSSYLLTGDYFFNKAKNIRPFLGIGAGLFRQTISGNEFPTTKVKSEKPGLETRLGLERKRFRVAVEYNATFFKEEKKMNFVTLKLGTFLWGGRKKK